jgi:hypothetical protein
LEGEVEEASEKYRVPKKLMLTIGYVNTYWKIAGAGHHTDPRTFTE